MKTIILKTIKFLILFYFIFGLLLYLFQDNLIYHKAKYVKHNFKTINIKSFDNKNINLITLNEGKDTAVLYLMGNAGSYIYAAKRMNQIDPNKKYSYYILNYRGYSGKEGEPKQNLIEKDILNIYDSIKNKYKKIIVVGRSLGTYFATYLASKREINKLILITPFDSIENIGKDRFWIYPVKYLLKEKYNTLKYINKVKTDNIYIILADNDNVVPFKNSKNLINHINKKIKYKKVKKTTHLNILWTQQGKSTLKAALEIK